VKRAPDRLLVVDDDPAQRELLAGFLRDQGFEVEEAGDGVAAQELLERDGIDLVLADLKMPRLDGAGLLRVSRQINPEVAFVLVTAHGSVRSAVESLRDGACDYLQKPLELAEVEHVVRHCLEQRRLRRENAELRRRLGEVESIPGIVTAGGAMSEVLSNVARVAASDVSVLIQGESGTGKELVARAIHAAGRRQARPFLAVNAAALSPTLLESELFGHVRGAFTGAERERIGRIEASSGGTLFLDEIGDLPAEVQVKLLRALQERAVERVGSNRATPVDLRLVSATHRDLAERVREGAFREDLYYRIAVVVIEIPPLRRRRADVPLLVEHFLRKHAALAEDGPRAVSREAMDLLVRYDWPGNVRELENVVQRALVLSRGEQVTIDDLPAALLGGRAEAGAGATESAGSLPALVAEVEQRAIDEALAAEHGNQSRAAARLGISERVLRYKLAKQRRVT
jgi:two-component system NtrC family response regulator